MSKKTTAPPAGDDDEREPDLWDICANRHKGDEMSKAANRITNKNRDRQRILDWLETRADTTGDEVRLGLNMPAGTVSARMSELKMMGLITKTERRPTSTGAMAQAWQKMRNPKPEIREEKGTT